MVSDPSVRLQCVEYYMENVMNILSLMCSTEFDKHQTNINILLGVVGIIMLYNNDFEKYKLNLAQRIVACIISVLDIRVHIVALFL